MNYTGNKLCFITLEIHSTLNSIQCVDYKFCFTQVDSINVEDQKTRSISYEIVQKKEAKMIFKNLMWLSTPPTEFFKPLVKIVLINYSKLQRAIFEL